MALLFLSILYHMLKKCYLFRYKLTQSFYSNCTYGTSIIFIYPVKKRRRSKDFILKSTDTTLISKDIQLTSKDD